MVALRWKAMAGIQLHAQAVLRVVFSTSYIGYSMHCISKPGMDSCRPPLLVSHAVAGLLRKLVSWGMLPN